MNNAKKLTRLRELIKVRAAQGQKSRGKKFGLKPIFFPNFKKILRKFQKNT